MISSGWFHAAKVQTRAIRISLSLSLYSFSFFVSVCFHSNAIGKERRERESDEVGNPLRDESENGGRRDKNRPEMAGLVIFFPSKINGQRQNSHKSVAVPLAGRSGKRDQASRHLAIMRAWGHFENSWPTQEGKLLKYHLGVMSLCFFVFFESTVSWVWGELFTCGLRMNLKFMQLYKCVTDVKQCDEYNPFQNEEARR